MPHPRRNDPEGVSCDDSEAGEPLGAPAILGRRRKRYRVDSDSEDDGPSDLDSQNASPLSGDEASSDSGDDYVAEDDVGDKELVPNPDRVEDEEDDDDVTIVMTLSEPILGINLQSPFARVLERVLIELKQRALNTDLVRLDREFRPMSVAYWAMTGKLSVNSILPIYLQAVPLEVQLLFEKEAWSLEDFLSLPGLDGDERQGICCNFATGDIRKYWIPTMSVTGDMVWYETGDACDAYAGSTNRLEHRVGQHLSIARTYDVATLPQEYARGLHYRQICRDGVQSNFRRLAAFDSPVPTGYLGLFEGIWMILLATYRHPGYLTKYATESSYTWTREIRESLNLPQVEWRGMNAAWSPHQGFYNTSANRASPCCNPDCNKMTWPHNAIPEGEPKAIRQLGDPGNPLGAYLCGRCSNYRNKWNKLPDKLWCESLDNILAARIQGGSDPVCHCCGKLESQNRQRSRYKKQDNIYHRFHDDFPGKLLCHACLDFVKSNRRLRDETELAEFLLTTSLADTRLAGGEISCDHCQVEEGDPVCSGKLHLSNRETLRVLCYNCDMYFRKHKADSPQNLIRWRGLKLQLKADRDAGVPVHCSNCDLVEGTLKNKKLFNANLALAVILCPPCGLHYTNHGVHRDVPLAHYQFEVYRLEKLRQEGKEPILCNNCMAWETSQEEGEIFAVDKDTLETWCPACAQQA